MAGKRFEIELKVGVFVTLGVALTMIAILVLGSTENLFSSKVHYNIHLNNTEGLIQGAKVVLSGVQIGTVEKIAFDLEARDIRIQIGVAKDSRVWIRQDSGAEIATQGVLGDKYVAITPGSADQPELPDNATIPNRPGKSLSAFLSQGDQLMASLNGIAHTLDHLLKSFEANNRSEIFFQGMARTAKNMGEASEKLNREFDDFHLRKTMKNLESITEKINNGTGTLGALINDPGLYYNAKALVGEANRNRIVRNLVRQTLKDSDAEAEKEEKKK